MVTFAIIIFCCWDISFSRQRWRSLWSVTRNCQSVSFCMHALSLPADTVELRMVSTQRCWLSSRRSFMATKSFLDCLSWFCRSIISPLKMSQSTHYKNKSEDSLILWRSEAGILHSKTGTLLALFSLAVTIGTTSLAMGSWSVRSVAC